MKKHTIRITIATLLAFSGISLGQSLSIDDTLFVGSNDGMEQNYEHLGFKYGGNNFPGMIFLKETQTIDPVDVTLYSETVASCTKQIVGSYYNPARGNRLRPLDADTLSERQAIDTSYNTLILTGGFYTDCSGDHPEAIYGYIQHTRLGTDFHIVAGTQMNALINNYNSIFDHTFTITNTLGINGYLYDPLGGIAQVGVGPTDQSPICGNGMIELGETCDDGNINNGDGCSSICQISPGRSCVSEPSSCTQIPEPPVDNEFNARLQLPSSYTNTVNVQGYLQANHPASYSISSGTQYIIDGTFALSGIVDIVLTAGDGIKAIQTVFTSLENDETVDDLSYITLDTVSPELTILTPTSGTMLTGGSTVTLTRTGSDDVAGIQEYQIQITNEDGLVIEHTTQNGSRTTPSMTNGTYTITITAYDKAGNTISQSITITIAHDREITISDIPAIDNAEPGTNYTSSPVIIAGLPANYSSAISVDTGVLVINNEEIGSGGFVHNGDSIQILLRASSGYNQTVSSTLSIENITKTFSITTKESDNDEEHNSEDYCPSRILMVIIAKSIFDAYQNEPIEKVEKVLEFLLEILEGEIQVLASHNSPNMYALQCFYDLIYEYLINIRTQDSNDENIRYYTAPNGKQYVVELIPDRQVYTSPNFVQPKFFATYTTFTHHIDKQNPSYISRDHIIDTSFQAVFHPAPSGKIYKIQKTNYGYMSYTFIAPRYFTTLQEIKTVINQNNKR